MVAAIYVRALGIGLARFGAEMGRRDRAGLENEKQGAPFGENREPARRRRRSEGISYPRPRTFLPSNIGLWRRVEAASQIELFGACELGRVPTIKACN